MPSPTEAAPTTFPGGPPSRRPGWPWKRWLPLAVLVGLMALVFTTGWHDFLSLKTVGTNYDRLRELISADLPASLAIYIAIYIAVVALSLPAAGILTITGGMLFGWQIGAPAAIAGATTGATVIFLIARSSIGDALASRAGPWLGRMREGFQRNALSYVLFLRLVPAFPFAVVKSGGRGAARAPEDFRDRHSARHRSLRRGVFYGRGQPSQRRWGAERRIQSLPGEGTG
jgi:hypothetical protein